jgi:SAM-dependent methyltransferase
MLVYAIVIFLSAFLLFQVQPVIAKVILPWFGGSAAVWSTCMLFFQAVLLLGYVYAHWLYHRVRGRGQAWLHSALLTASLLALPILPNPRWRTAAAGDPSWRILALLALTIGLPYFLLSSTSPLLQAWYSRTNKRAMPYRLFALSNLASMLALLSYPVLVEPNLTVRTQAGIWSAGYGVFAVLCAVAAWRSSSGGAGELVAGLGRGRRPAIGPDESGPQAESQPHISDRVLWTAFAACASILLLAVTTHLTQNVAAIPFLWILPLSTYLLTFILCFESPRVYRREIFLPLLALAIAFLAYELYPFKTSLDIRPLITLLTLSLFVCCMVCHGEVARRRPAPQHLTSFYVSISLGGALGGIFVGLAAPRLFNGYYEFHLGLALCAALAAITVWNAAARLNNRPRFLARIALAAGFCAYVVSLGLVFRDSVKPYRYVSRNFYAQLRVRDDGDPKTDRDARRKLIHGTINHGQQMLRAEYSRLPVSYFCPQSGIGRAMSALEGAPRRIGILGLGCGTLAAYGRPGDIIRIYEINPQVIQIARSQFTYLSDTAARLEVALGDARQVLESEPSQQFDVLVMDAFSGDSVPVHLITREAFTNYFRHLKPDGIVAVNVSNRYLNLQPVMAAAAAAFGKVALLYEYYADEEDFLCFDCTWVLIMDRKTADAHPALEKAGKVLERRPGFRVWTDDFSNLFGILM